MYGLAKRDDSLRALEPLALSGGKVNFPEACVMATRARCVSARALAIAPLPPAFDAPEVNLRPLSPCDSCRGSNEAWDYTHQTIQSTLLR